jgi:type I restriction enzyme S subunit
MQIENNKYNTYKDSDIEWIGEIPQDWNLIRAKYLFSQSFDKGGIHLVLLSATQNDGVIPKDRLEGVVQVKEDSDLRTFKTVKKGDFVISLRSFQGGFEYSNFDGVITPAYTVFRKKESICDNYFKKLFKSDGFIAKINSLTTGIREGKNIQYEDFANMLLPLLSIHEQQQIADYLDKKCGEIDRVVEIQKDIIEKLKEYKQSVITEAVTKGLDKSVPLKDSGIEWIGKIPEHWECQKLKQLISKPLQYGANESGEEYNEDFPRYIRITDIKIEDNSLKSSDKLSLKPEKAKNYILEDNDILFARSGATVGKTFLYKTIYGISAFAGYLIRVNVKKCINAKYIYYFTLSNSYDEWKKRIFIQATIQNIGANKYNNLEIALPEIKEQDLIVKYLDQKCSEIDSAISDKEKLIEKLTEYKKSLIYECVTGKRKVVI